MTEHIFVDVDELGHVAQNQLTESGVLLIQEQFRVVLDHIVNHTQIAIPVEVLDQLFQLWTCHFA